MLCQQAGEGDSWKEGDSGTSRPGEQEDLRVSRLPLGGGRGVPTYGTAEPPL